jgi:uncharacterized protein YecE (DUF72 family)
LRRSREAGDLVDNRHAVRILVGTSGYAYREWKGGFYPKELSADAMLGYYARRFETVEINATFYKMPTAAVLEGWAREVPESFTFALKSPQRITHRLRLKDASEALSFFLGAAATLGARLGPLLFQLPPNLKKDFDRLAAFLDLLPPGIRAAFEFRHESWFDDDVYEALRAHRAALCIADDEKLTTPLVSTADWGYFRLRRLDYAPDQIQAWGERVRSQPWGEAFVYFKHEDTGAGPRFAEELIEGISGGFALLKP